MPTNGLELRRSLDSRHGCIARTRCRPGRGLWHGRPGRRDGWRTSCEQKRRDRLRERSSTRPPQPSSAQTDSRESSSARMTSTIAIDALQRRRGGRGARPTVRRGCASPARRDVRSWGTARPRRASRWSARPRGRGRPSATRAARAAAREAPRARCRRRRAGRCSRARRTTRRARATVVIVSGGSPEFTSCTAARSDASVCMGEQHVDSLRDIGYVSSAMTAMARWTGTAGIDVRAGLPLARRLRRVVRALGTPWRAGFIDAGWSPGAVVLARIAIAALVGRAVRRARPARPMGAPARATRASSSSTVPCRSPARSSPYFSAVRGDGRRPGPADRVHGPGRRSSRGSGCATASGPGRADARRRRRSPAIGPRARPGSPLGRRPGVGRRRSGPSRPWSVPRRTSSCRPTRAAACPRSPWRAAGSRPARIGAGRARRRRPAADARDDRGVRPTRARPSRGGCPSLALGIVTAAVAYTHRHRREPAPRLPPGLVRRAARGRRRRCSSPGCCSTSSPAPLQLAGGVLIVAGVVVVKLGERPPLDARAVDPPAGAGPAAAQAASA